MSRRRRSRRSSRRRRVSRSRRRSRRKSRRSRRRSRRSKRSRVSRSRRRSRRRRRKSRRAALGGATIAALTVVGTVNLLAALYAIKLIRARANQPKLLSADEFDELIQEAQEAQRQARQLDDERQWRIDRLREQIAFQEEEILSGAAEGSADRLKRRLRELGGVIDAAPVGDPLFGDAVLDRPIQVHVGGAAVLGESPHRRKASLLHLDFDASDARSNAYWESINRAASKVRRPAARATLRSVDKKMGVLQKKIQKELKSSARAPMARTPLGLSVAATRRSREVDALVAKERAEVARGIAPVAPESQIQRDSAVGMLDDFDASVHGKLTGNALRRASGLKNKAPMLPNKPEIKGAARKYPKPVASSVLDASSDEGEANWRQRRQPSLGELEYEDEDEI